MDQMLATLISVWLYSGEPVTRSMSDYLDSIVAAQRGTTLTKIYDLDAKFRHIVTDRERERDRNLYALYVTVVRHSQSSLFPF